MIMEVLQYIRSLLSTKTKRKRSAQEDFDFPSKIKRPKIHISPLSTLEDDWVSSTSSLSVNHSKASYMEPTEIVLRPWLKHTSSSPIIIEDDFPMNKKVVNGNTSNKSHATSTPNTSRLKENGVQEFSFLKFDDVAKRPPIRKNKLELLKPPSSYFNTVSANPKKSNFFTGLKDVSAKLSTPSLFKRPSYSYSTPMNDFGFRLDEKRKYEELINKAQNVSSFDIDSFAEYGTPVGKISPASRGRRMVNMVCNNIKPTEVVDLTKGDAKSKRLSTRQTILKVIDSIDNDVIHIKDTDSDVEILPNPPSPKPDFSVEPINSLKTFVLPSEPLHHDWVSNKVKRHAEEIAKREREIAIQTEQLKKISLITNEVKTKQLEDKINKCLHIKDIVLPIDIRQKLPELSDHQQKAISLALDKTQDPNAILSSKFSLNITRRDMLTLAGLNWLNDEVINFYMNMIIERGKSDKYPNTYAFNTFFYPKLLKDGHSSIRRWTRRIDVFSYDLICVPIHLGMHWCMAIIDFRTKQISYYDSMGKANVRCIEALLNYLVDEHVDKKKSDYDTSDWKLKCLKDIPQQMNGSDCGMFSCTNAEFVSRNAPLMFSQEDMPYLRRKMVLEILSGQLLIN